MIVVYHLVAIILLGFGLFWLARRGGPFLAATATIGISYWCVWGLQWSLLHDPNPSWAGRFCLVYCLVGVWQDLFKRFPGTGT